MNIADIIQKIAKGNGSTAAMVCRVIAGDKDARTVDCEPLNEEAPILGANLQANQNSTVGFVQFPRIGSFVIVGFAAEGAAGVVLLCEDVEEIQITVKDKDTASIIVNDTGIIMNGGSLGGMVKVEKLTQRLNIIEKDINKLKQIFNSWQPKPNDGGAALKTPATLWATDTLIETQRTDYENTKIKQ